MTRFGAIEAVTGEPRFVDVAGNVKLTQREKKGDLFAKFDPSVTEVMLDDLRLLVTLAYGNPPIPEIELSIKADKSGRTVLNGNEIGLEQLLIGSESIVNLVKLDEDNL